MTLNDAILAATGGPTVNDGLRAWFSVGVANPQNYSLNDLERAWLKIQNPTTTATTISDMWMDYLKGVGGIIPGTLNDMQRQYWNDNITPPAPGVNEHDLTVGDGISSYGYLVSTFGNLSPLLVGGQTVFGLYSGSNDSMYIEFTGGVQIAGVSNIEVRTPNGRVICVWIPGALHYKSDPYDGLFDAMATEVDSVIRVTITTL